ncbi:hypothetical protein VP01_616g1 [Puccinia sorghi]|uniref:Uncharacterized protein n=1 Tax=Puccinia sorghi TaxID=27349 RepID=A0A0L6UGV4_9BASI|nr:hypothetical protein VP01_616g1 [Puccinia sorghi]
MAQLSISYKSAQNQFPIPLPNQQLTSIQFVDWPQLWSVIAASERLGHRYLTRRLFISYLNVSYHIQNRPISLWRQRQVPFVIDKLAHGIRKGIQSHCRLHAQWISQPSRRRTGGASHLHALLCHLSRYFHHKTNASTVRSLPFFNILREALIQNWTLITGNIFPDRNGGAEKSIDPHLQEMKKYSDVPHWFLGCMSLASVALGYLCATLAESRLSVVAMLASVLLAAVIIGSIGFLNATTGFNPVETSSFTKKNALPNDLSYLTLYLTACAQVVAPACQMIGSIFGGSVIRSLWFSIFSATCATISLLIAKELSHIFPTLVNY